MNKAIRSLILFSMFATLLVVSAVPLMAQTNGEVDDSVCFHYDLLTSTGEYIYLYLTEEQLIDLLNNLANIQDIIEVVDPNSILSGDVILSPEHFLIVASPDGDVEAAILDGEFDAFGYGAGSWYLANMVTDCLNDGRLNILAQAMLAAIYPDGAGGYVIWRVDPTTSHGFFDYQVIYAQIADALALANSTGQPQVIASGETSTLYALINGECQLNSPDAQGIMQEFTFTCAIGQ